MNYRHIGGALTQNMTKPRADRDASTHETTCIGFLIHANKQLEHQLSSNR